MKKTVISSIALTLGLAVSFEALAITIISPVRVPVMAPRIVSTPAPTVKPSTSAPSRVTSTPPARQSVPSKSSASSSNMIPLFVPIMLMSHSSSASSTAKAVEVATPLLTACTREQAAKAESWQADCRNIIREDSESGLDSSYCPILSYFRYCDEITPEEASKLKPLKEQYKHIFLRDQ